MTNHVHSISLNYGETEVSFYNIQLRQSPETPSLLHTHTYYELHLLSRQPLPCHLQDRVVCLHPDELLILPPQVPHQAFPASPPHTVLSVSLSGNEQLAEQLNKNALKPFPFSCPQEVELLNQDEPYRSFLGLCRLKAIAANFVYRLFTQLTENQAVAVSGKQDTLVLMENLIGRPDITLAEIAEAINYSQRHTARLIEKHYGGSLSSLRKEGKYE